MWPVINQTNEKRTIWGKARARRGRLLLQTGRAWLLVLIVCALAACGSGTASSAAPTPTPGVTPTPTATTGVTPTPTIPDIRPQTVHFTTKDHIQLTGLSYGHGKTVIICSHELGTTKAIWAGSGIPQRLAARGYQVLAYDFRGNGESTGLRDLDKLDIDLQAAVAFARSQGAKSIVLLGASMGGTATLNVASSEQVAAVITLSAPQDFGPGVSVEQLKAIKAPKLFVNSQNDDYISDTMSMYSQAVAPKEIEVYPGSAHGVDIFDTENGNNLTQRILTFIGRYAPAR